MPLTPPTLKQPLRALLTEIAEVVADIGGEFEAASHQVAIFTLFERCRSAFNAVRVLLDFGFGQEAVVLGRPLFTESLMLAELASVDERRRVEIVVGWSLAGLDSWTGIVREAVALDDDDDVAADRLAQIATKRASFEQYAANHDAGTKHWEPAEKALAQAHGRAEEYLDFRLAHHFVHGSQMAAEQRSAKRSDDSLVIGGPDAHFETWGPAAGLFAATSALHASRAMCRIFGWAEPSELDDLQRRCDDAAADFNAA